MWLGLAQAHAGHPCAVTGWEGAHQVGAGKRGGGWGASRCRGCYRLLSSEELITTAGSEARTLETLACPGPASPGAETPQGYRPASTGPACFSPPLPSNLLLTSQIKSHTGEPSWRVPGGPVGPALGPWASEVSPAPTGGAPSSAPEPPAQVLRRGLAPKLEPEVRGQTQPHTPNPDLLPGFGHLPGGRVEPLQGRSLGKRRNSLVLKSLSPSTSAQTHAELLPSAPRERGWLHLWRIDTSVHRGNTIHSAPAYGLFF